jgi:hypothetical protein
MVEKTYCNFLNEMTQKIWKHRKIFVLTLMKYFLYKNLKALLNISSESYFPICNGKSSWFHSFISIPLFWVYSDMDQYLLTYLWGTTNIWLRPVDEDVKYKV